MLFPLGRGVFSISEEFAEGVGVDVERREDLDVALDHLKHVGRHILGVVPMLFVPLLQNRDRLAGNLDVQLNVLGQAGAGEVG